MENQSNLEERIAILRQKNPTCFDCGRDNAPWCSINNGIFLCLECSKIHRKMGSYVSIVRSSELDSWSSLQVEYLENGGNEQLKQLFEKYNIKSDFPSEFKFKTFAAEYYRSLIKSKVDNKPPPEEPSVEDGLLLLKIGDDSDDDQNDDQNSGSQYLINTFKNSAKFAIGAGKQVIQKVKDPEFQQQIKEQSLKTFNQTKEYTQKKAQESRQAGIENAIKLQAKSKEYAEKSKEVAKKLAESSKRVGNQLAENTSKGIKEGYKAVNQGFWGAFSSVKSYWNQNQQELEYKEYDENVNQVEQVEDKNVQKSDTLQKTEQKSTENQSIQQADDLKSTDINA